MAAYVTYTSFHADGVNNIPLVRELWSFRSLREAQDFAEQLAEANKLFYLTGDAQGRLTYAGAFQLGRKGVAYDTVQVLTARGK